jgi:hypothetical protein
MARYLSEQWRAEVEKRLREQLTTAELEHITVSLNCRYSNCPGGGNKYFFLNAVNGVIDRILVGEGDGPESDYCISGDYDVLASVSRAELSLQKALIGGMLKFSGSVIRAFSLSRLSDRIFSIIAEIDTEF